jgi:hypothetical protein
MIDKHHLHEQLQELHRELHHVESVDAHDRHLLHLLMEDLQALLEHPGEHTPSQYERLSERLAESIARLEASHPRVTMFMGQIADTLAKMGI